MTVWIEYAIIQNFAIDFILLFLTVKSLKLKLSVRRLLLTTVAGTLFAIIYPLVELPSILKNVVKFLFGAIMALSVIESKNSRHYITGVLLFYFLTFCYGGMLFGIFNLFHIRYNEGYYVMAESPFGLFIAILPLFMIGVMALFYRLFQKYRQQKLIYECVIGEEQRLLKGFLDTGNGIYYKGKPVCLIDKRAASAMSVYGKVLGCISVKTATGNGVLSIFSDSLQIYSEEGKNIIDKVYFAISPIPLEGEYELILHMGIFTEIR